MNYYQHHIGDYRRDTTHLSLLEHGIYRQMLDQYYLDERPICVDDAKLMRSLCARSADEMQAVKSVLSDFFVLTDAGYMHKRCDVEIEAFHGKSKSASESAKARWERVRTEKAAKSCEVNANALPTQSEGNANHKPLTTNQEPVTKKQRATPPALPDWIPADQWSGYMEMRKAIKKPPTDRAIELLIASLDKMRAAGQDVGAVLDKSVANNWTDVYAIKPPAGTQVTLGRGAAPADLAAAQRASTEEAKRRLFGNKTEVFDA